MTPSELTRRLRQALTEARDPSKAEPMQRYMKSTMPFLGVQKPERVRACRPIWTEVDFEGGPALFEAVEGVWNAARYREERYAAIDLLTLRRYRAFHDLALRPTLEKLITEGAWWDLVDACASSAGRVLLRAPSDMTEVLHGWAQGQDLWLRRSAIIAHLDLKEATNFGLLAELINESLHAPGLISPLSAKDQRFFLAKAAGWALRTYARMEPERVRTYLEQRPDLPPLTKREAAKHL